jgi:hypothetical protein
MRRRFIRSLILVAAGVVPAAAQTPADGFMLAKRDLHIGVVYAHDTWDEYWEGTLKRRNGNIGTITTQSVTWGAAYGITDRLDVMASLPYVWTRASQGVLSGMQGVQDLTFAAKYKLLAAEAAGRGAFSAVVVGAAAVPVGNYTPDFLPLSIGNGDGRASGRLTLNFQSTRAWFAAASTAYTWCSNVTLNRDSYFTNGQLYMTNAVAMPNVLEHSLTAGYRRGRWQVPLSLVQQRTLGGGDIRRQDMPFVSNRMDFVKLDGALMFALPVVRDVSIRVGAGHVLSGRNVGQSTTFTSGLSHALHF